MNLDQRATTGTPTNSGNHTRDSLESDGDHARTVEERLAVRASAPQNFTLRSIILGLLIGVVIVFSNTYFGLQTGWISGMAMPSALIGFATFRGWAAAFPEDGTSGWRRAFRLRLPFSPVENVLIQTVASSMGTMPLGCGFVGVIVALEFLLRLEADGQGPMDISFGKLCIWAIGICLFGVVFAVPLRREVIIREKLKFPSGTATALMIDVLHGEKGETKIVGQGESSAEDERVGLISNQDADEEETEQSPKADNVGNDWKRKIGMLALAFAGSAVYTVFSYFVPQIHRIPIFGNHLANVWLWQLNPSPAYVGQGIIMGPATTAHMLLGAILGWAILSPLAKSHGWAPGDVDDWSDGSKGWIVWVSLAIMLADSIVSLAWLVARPSIYYLRVYGRTVFRHARRGKWSEIPQALNTAPSSRRHVQEGSLTLTNSHKSVDSIMDAPEADAPPEHLIHTREFLLWLAMSVALYFVSIHVAFPRILPFGLDIFALVLAVLLSIMGVRALGSTDLNPVSGISKLTQLLFAAIVPSTNANAVTINLLAGAISESAALQAGDLLQDLKTGHLLGAAPNAQFYGQLIGSVAGAVTSAGVYKLYTATYQIPSDQFQVPTGYVWLFTAELVTGKGLPDMAGAYALAAAVLFTVLTIIRIAAQGKRWCDLVPGGIAVAVGMYNTPNFTLARAAGGLVSWYYVKWKGNGEAGVVVLASGLILGEGLFSILNLGLASAKVPHL